MLRESCPRLGEHLDRDYLRHCQKNSIIVSRDYVKQWEKRRKMRWKWKCLGNLLTLLGCCEILFYFSLKLTLSFHSLVLKNWCKVLRFEQGFDLCLKICKILNNESLKFEVINMSFLNFQNTIYNIWVSGKNPPPAEFLKLPHSPSYSWKKDLLIELVSVTLHAITSNWP